MKIASPLLVILCLSSAVISVAATFKTFDEIFKFNFGEFNAKKNGAYESSLSLTKASGSYSITLDCQGMPSFSCLSTSMPESYILLKGSGFESKSAYLFGYIAMKLKLVPGNSAGIVTAYYLSSTNERHCELDFEFLGNVTGQPYILQTNVFVEGVGDREQRITLWFDPSAEFHNYGILWNKDLILFFVDDRAIRVFHNAVSLGVPYLDYQEMYSYSSVWDGETWATRGGRDKIDWKLAPFIATYRDFDIEACPVTKGTAAEKHKCYHSLYTEPYGNTANRTLTTRQWNDLKWIQTKWLIYDYCTDKGRWTTQPKECSVNWPK